MSQLPIQANVRMGEALAQVAYLPVCAQGAMKTAVFDIVSHHRLSMIKQAAKWPGGRRAQAMVASRLHRFSKDNDGDAGVTGQGFAAAVTGTKFGPDQFMREETGKEVSSSEFMAIPIGAGLAMTRSGIKGRRQEYRDLIASRQLKIIRSRGKLLVIRELKGRGKKDKGLRSQILAVLVKRRSEPGRLNFYSAFDRVQASDVAKLEAIIDLAATEAGRMKLEERVRTGEASQTAYRNAFREFLQDNPRKFAQARAAGKAAARAARGVISGGEGRA